jgi:hypothetical protein
MNSNIGRPEWILDASIKVVEDRLRTGFETKQKPGKLNDERKIYQSKIRDYYRWRAVRKYHLPETLGNKPIIILGTSL